MAFEPNIIIGKVPGYNNKTNLYNPEFYNKRLTSSISHIDLTPTGYIFNTHLITEAASAADTPIFQLGTDIAEDLKDKDGKKIVGSLAAYKLWESVLEGAGLNPTYQKIRILGTNESTINESINNEFGQNYIESLLDNSLTGSLSQITKNLKGAKGLVGGFSSTTPVQALQMMAKSESSLLGVLAGKALGINMSMPQIWHNSSYSSNLQLLVKLVSPTGSPDDIRNFILKPLKLLILMASPISVDGILYGYPSLWNIEARGLMSIKLGGVESIILTRGGNDTAFTKDQLPQNVDARIIFKPIIQGFATPLKEGNAYNMAKNYTMPTTNIYDIEKSMTIEV